MSSLSGISSPSKYVSAIMITQLLAKGIPDKEKSTKAIELAKDFRVKIRECDDAASRSVRDAVVKITANFPSTYEELETFFQLMSDVPDEL